MFSLLFQNVAIDNFHCHICELTNHHCVSFPLNNKRASKPFFLIHGDVWGPSKVTSLTGLNGVSFIDDYFSNYMVESYERKIRGLFDLLEFP